MKAGNETEIYKQGYKDGYNDGENARIDPDYWTRLEHQAAITAMQALLTHHGATVSPDWINEEAESYAHALVEKMKNQSV